MSWGRNKKSRTPFLPPPTKFDRLTEGALIDAVDAAMRRGGELFRGFNHSEIDKGWMLAELETQIETALLATQALRRRVASVQRD